MAKNKDQNDRSMERVLEIWERVERRFWWEFLKVMLSLTIGLALAEICILLVFWLLLSLQHL